MTLVGHGSLQRGSSVRRKASDYVMSGWNSFWRSGFQTSQGDKLPHVENLDKIIFWRSFLRFFCEVTQSVRLCTAETYTVCNCHGIPAESAGIPWQFPESAIIMKGRVCTVSYSICKLWMRTKIHKTFCLNQCCGSVTFWGGSGSGSADPCLWLIDPDPDPGSGSCYFCHWPSRCQPKTNF